MHLATDGSALALRRHGLSRLRAPDRALARGGAGRARRSHRSRTNRPSSSSAKGASTRTRTSQRLMDEGNPRRGDRARARPRLGACRPRDRRGDARRRRRRLPGRASSGDGWRGLADFLLRVDTPSELGAWSYEALDTKLARHAKPAYILQLCFYSEQLARIQGLRPELIHVLLGNRHAGELPAAGVRRLLPAGAAGGSRTSSPTRRRPSLSPSTTAASATSSRSATRTGTRSTTSRRVARIQRRQIERLGAAGITTLAALGQRAAPSRVPPASPRTIFEKLREPGRAAAPRARDRRRRATCILPAAAATGFALLPDPSPGDLFFDFEGNPFWDHEGSLEYLWGILDARRRVRAALGDDPRRGARRPSSASSTSSTRGSRRPGAARLPLRAVRDHGAAPTDGPLRHARGGARRPAPARRLRRPLQGRARRPADLAAGLRAQGARASCRFERDAEINDGGASIVVFEQWMLERDQRDPRRDRRLQPRGLHRDACSCATGCSSGAQEALDAFGPFPPPEPVESKPIKPEKAERVALREALLATGDEPARSRRSCSTTTTASASRSGGRSSTGST